MPATPTYVPTEQQKSDAARFVVYELWMLRSVACMPKPVPRVERNLWYEGIILHTRVLRDFFFTKHNKKGRATHDTDIVAVDYFTLGASSWPYTSKVLTSYLGAHKDRMDWTLAHLTYGRLAFTGSEKDWSAEKLRSEIGEKWIEFIEKLQDAEGALGPGVHSVCQTVKAARHRCVLKLGQLTEAARSTARRIRKLRRTPAAPPRLMPVYTTPCASDPIQLYSGPIEVTPDTYVGAGNGTINLIGRAGRFEIPTLPKDFSARPVIAIPERTPRTSGAQKLACSLQSNG